MAIAPRAHAAAATTNPTTTWTVVLSSTILSGDDIYVFVTSRDHTSGTARVTCTDDDSGGNTWALISESTDRKASVFWKKATSATASKTVTIAGAVGSSSGGYSAYSGGAPTPHTNISVQDNASGVQTHTGFTPAAADSVILLAVFNTGNNNNVSFQACTNPGSLVERFVKLSTGGSDSACEVASETQLGGPTATGDFTWTQTAGTTKSIVFAIKPNLTPTVVANAPPDGSSATNTIPVLEFTGTDVDSDDLRYHVQLDTVSTFDSSPAPNTTVDSYSESNQSGTSSLFSTTMAAGQTFTPVVSGLLDSVKFYLQKVGTPTGNAVAKIYAMSGTHGTDGVPTGAALATSDNFDVSTLTTSFALITFTFTGGNIITLNSGTNYVAIIEFNSASPNYVRVGIDFSSPTHSGNYASYFGGAWAANAANDTCFYVILDAQGPLLDIVSGTDAGFANTVNGGDTDPFTSGEKISFTMTEPLAPRRYYWRVRAKDPLGTDTYSAFTQTRFVVSEELIPEQTLAVDTTTTGSADTSAEMPEQYDVSSTVSEVTDTVMDMTVSSKQPKGKPPSSKQ